MTKKSHIMCISKYDMHIHDTKNIVLCAAANITCIYITKKTSYNVHLQIVHACIYVTKLGRLMCCGNFYMQMNDKNICR